MRLNKLLLVSLILLAILTFGAVNAADDAAVDNLTVADDGGSYEIASSVEEIEVDGDIATDVSSSDNAFDDNVNDNSNVKLGASSDNDVLSDDYEILTPDDFHERGFDSGTVCTGNYKLEGVFTADEFPSFMFIDGGCVIDASEAEFQDIGIILQGDVQLSGLTLTSSKYLEDVDNGMSPGAIVYVTGDDNILDGLTVNYAPTPDGDAYGIYVESANNFQLLNSKIQFTGSSVEEYYEYAMRIAESNGVLIEGNTLIANLPILPVDYNKGEPGLQTDLVLNTGLKSVDGLDIIDNTFIANVVDRYGDFPTLDCVMMESCDNVNIIGNTFEESDFITPEGEANYLNVLDMYYSDNVLVKGNNISVETTGGSENAGTSYPVQLTGPYEGVVVDGNNIYSNCGGPALGIYSQNYYGNTEITVQNNNIDITGLPTDHSWGLVSGIELQDNVARVYNNNIVTKSVTGSFEEGQNIYGISYAQALNDDHNYDIRGNTIETEGQYTIYLLKAEDTTITDNYLVSSTGEGDDTVYINDASGNTIIENNHGAKEEVEPFYGVVTAETFSDFFNNGVLRDEIPAGATLDFQGQFISTSSNSYAMEINKPVNIISTTKDVYINLDATSSNRFTVSFNGSGSNISDLSFFNTQLWFFGAHNLTINNMTSIARGKEIGSGVGVVAFRGGSSHIKVTNSYFLTEDNGGHSNFVLTNASYVSVDNSSIIGRGNVGNLIYLNLYNLETMPEGWFLPQLLQAIAKGQITVNDHNNFTNCYIQGPDTALGICYLFTNQGNGFNRFENNTVVYTGAGIQSFGNDGVIKGNTFIGCGINAAGARTEVTDNNITGGVGITASGNNVITGNTINTTSDYAVSLGKTKDNTVTDNYLISNGKKGDGAVNLGTGSGNQVHDNLPVDIILSVQNSTIWLGEENSVTVTIAGAGEVTIKLNGVVIATPTLTDGAVTQTIPASDIVLGENTIEVTYRGLTNSTTFTAEENAVEPTNIVTQENFFDFFDADGFLLDTVEFDELIFSGEFSDLISDNYILITRPITITGDNAVLNDMGICIMAPDVKLDQLTFIADDFVVDEGIAGGLIAADDNSDGFELTNSDISFTTGAEMGVAIDIKCNDAKILNNSIFFESHVTDDSLLSVALQMVDAGNALVDGNIITTKLPCVYVNNYDEDYYLMGSNNVNPVRLKDCNNLVFTNNFINSTTNDYSADFPTIQSIYIIGCSDSLIDHNEIYMIDEMTPAGMDNYMYGIDFGHNTNVTFSYNNFIMSTKGGQDQHGTAYAFQGVESEVIIKGNNITSVSNGPNLGIYVASMFGGDSKLLIEDNFINVTGYASSTGSWALVSGIEIQNGDAKIYNNTVYTYNVGDYEDGAYMYGISYAQWMYGDRSFDIQNNTVYTEGKYTISVINATFLNAEGNTLYAHELSGDDSINPGNCTNVTLKENLPPRELTNIVTNDTFFRFFDENGILLDTIEFDELIFQGEFSDLVNTIIISDEITLTSDNAVLNNIALYITGDDVTVTGFTLNENDANFTNNGGAALYVSGSDVTLDNVSVTYNAPSEVEAKAIFANGAENFALINSEIIFTGANPGFNHYRGLEVRNSNAAKIDNNTISAVLPAVPVAFSASGIDQDLVLAVGIQGGEDVEFTNNIVNVNTNGAVGSYPTIDAVMIHSANDLLVKGNNITHIDTTTEDGARYYYSLDIYSTTGTVEANNIIVNTTAGVDRAGTAYPIQLTGPYTITVKDNNLTAVSKGPIAGIYTSNWPGAATLTVENNNIDVTGYATTGNYALVAGIEAEIDVFKAYNNTITVANGAEYDDANQVIGVGIGSSYFYGDTSADIKDNNITVDGKYAVYYAKAINTNVTGNTLYGHELEGDDAAYIGDGTNNVIENNLPVSKPADIVIESNPVWIGSDATVVVNVANATGTVTIEINGKSYPVELDNGVATQDIAVEDLVVGENDITVTYEGPEFKTTTATGVIYVADGVVTQDTYMYYFNQEDAGRFFDYVPEGATLDFQGSIINPDQNAKIWFNVNKPVNIITTTNDAFIDLNTTAGSLTGDNPGNRFTIGYGGSGSNMTGINFHNTQLWIANTHNVVLDNISNVVEDQRVGSGVGATSVRENCTYVTVKNSYFYTRNNGGSSSLVMAWADYCTFDNNTIVVEGNVGNMIYLTTFNVNVPSGVVANVHNNITNNHIYSPNSASAICWALVLSGSDNLIENNTIEYKGVGITTQFGSAASPNNTYRNNKMLNGSSMSVLPDSVLYNNTITGALTVGARSVAYNNTVGGKMNVAQGAHAYDNTVAGGVATTGTDAIIENNTITGAVTINKVGTTFIGNDVNGTVTVSANNNVIKGNNITTTGNYAVDLGSKTGNNVTDNYLVAALYKGDAAVKFSNANNIVENNLPVAPVVVVADSTWIGNNATVTVTVANTTGTVTITVNGKDQTVELVDGVATVEVAGEDLAAGTNVLTVTYNGPEYAPLTVEDVIVVLDGVVTQDTYMYYFNQEDAGRFFDYVPEGATLDFQGSIINPDQNAKIWFNVNKPVNIITTTNDAFIDLNTTAGSLTGDNPGNRFTIGYGGSGSNMTGINFHNTQLWIANTHNVVLDNISNVVEDQRVGSGVGATSVRENCTYVTVKNSYFYTRNNGGSSSLVMAWADYCTFDNNTIVVEGNVGNMIYLTTFNVNVPSGVVANVHNNITNNHIYSPNSASAICWALVLSGSDNLIENNTIEYKGVGITTQFGSAASPNNTYRNNKMLNGSSMSVLPDSVLYNNTITGALTVGARSVAYNNTVGGKMNVAQGAHAYDNTVAGGVATTGTDAIIENNTITGAVTINKVGTTFIGNDVNGTVTVSANNNVIKGNNITTTGNYAVDLGSKTGNNVTDNYLVAALYKGDAAVKFSNANNIVENNYPVSTVLTAEDLDMTYKDGSAWVVTLTDGTNPIEGAVVKVGILGKTYSLKTGADGTVTLPINVAPGNYDVSAAYDGDGLHESAFVNATVTVGKAVSTLTAENITMSYKNGSWIVTLTGAEGVIPKAAIKFGILGKVYTVETDENGVAALAINLAPGTYQINATFGGNAKHESAFVDATVTVEKAVATIASEDLTMSYKDGSAYAVTVTDAKGAVLAGTTVKFTFGTKSYNIKTDANGVASLPINLNIGEYTVNAVVDDAKYTSEEVTNTVTVTDYDAVLVANDINMTYQDGTNYEVQLTTADGTPITVANLVVKITLLGKTYSIKTDSEGIAKLPINLRAGTYVFTAEYNGNQVNSTVVVNKA